MASIKTTKRIGSTGDSLIIPITREAKEYGLEKGDMISVIIPDPSESENHDYEFACMLSNPNAAYENTRPLTPSDTLLDGEPIPDRSKEIDSEPLVHMSTLIRHQSLFINTLKNAVRSKLNSDYARYSDTMRSFIVEFEPTTFVGHEYQVAMDQMCTLTLLKELNDNSCAFYSPLKSVSSLADHLERALDDTKEYYTRLMDGDEQKEDVVKKLNKNWDEEISGRQYPDMWYVAVTASFPIDDYPDYYGSVEFGIYEAPCAKYVDDLLASEEPENIRRHAMIDRVVLGPYANQDDAQDMMSHFRMAARSNNWSVDQEFTTWCKNESRRIMDV